MKDNSYPPVSTKAPYESLGYQKSYKSPEPEPLDDIPKQMDDFELLLEQYRRIQEQIDELGPVSQQNTFVDDLIDDTFVDIPLDDNRVFDQEKENLNSIDFNDESMLGFENSATTFTGEREDDGGEYIPGKFSPFRINQTVKRVRTLSELNKLDLLERGLEHDDMSTNEGERGDIEGFRHTEGQQGSVGGGQRTRKGRISRTKKRRRRRPSLESSRCGSKASSSDVYEKLGVVKLRDGGRYGRNNR